MMTNPLVTMPFIPDDLLLNCLAHVSRLYYPTLSLVFKRSRSLIASHDLYETRKLLRRTESCLYLCLRLSSEHTTRWYTLSRRPTRNPNPSPNSRLFTPCRGEKEKKSSDYLMVSVPTHNFSPLIGWVGAAIGYNIYTIGGYFSGEFSSRVYFMDCRSHTWHEAPSMQTPRKYPHVNVLDGKIYVVNGCKDPDSSNFIEYFDPETQIGEYVPSPSEILESIKLKRCLAIQGELCLYGDKNVGYMSKEKKWDVVRLLGLPLALLDSNYSSCVIDNVVYMYNEPFRRLLWCDSEGSSVGVLKGLEELPRFPTCFKLVNYGGNIVVLWEEKVGRIGPKKKTIWCAEIAVERRGNKIYGNILWCDVVLTLSEPYEIVQVISATV